MSEFNISQIIGQSKFLVQGCCRSQFEKFIKSYFSERPLLLYRQDNDSVFFSLFLGDIELRSNYYEFEHPSECISQFSDLAVLLARLISDDLPF